MDKIATPDIEFAGIKAQLARLRPEIERRIGAVLDHGRFINGPEVAELETAIAGFAGVGHAVGVSSGTDALLMALMGEDIGPGDAVFMPSFTFTATAEVAVLLGARPVFVDVDPHSFDIDADDLSRCIGETLAAGTHRPRAVIAVDLFGQPADYAALAAVCDTHGLLLIADAAQSFGATLGGSRVGGLAPVTTTSFFPAKPLGGYGDGGAILTDDAERAARYRSIRAHGKGEAKYDIARLGLNARLDTLQAAILLVKLTVLDEELAARARLAAGYSAALGNVVATPRLIDGAESAWAQYSILVDDRDALASALGEAGVPTAIYYPRPIHLQPAYAAFGAGPGSLPVSEALSDRILSLPMNPYQGEPETEHITAAIAETLGSGG